MKQIFYQYREWEDYQNGLYSVVSKEKENIYINKAVFLLTNEKLLFEIMYKVITEWKISSRQNLSDVTCNRKSWLGQSACCYYSKTPEYLTRKAWVSLTQKQMDKANNIANKVIDIWEKENAEEKQLCLF